MKNKESYTIEEIKLFLEVYTNFNKKIEDFVNHWRNQGFSLWYLYPRILSPNDALETDLEMRDYIDKIERLESTLEQYNRNVPENFRNLFISKGYPDRVEHIMKDAKREKEKRLEILTKK